MAEASACGECGAVRPAGVLADAPCPACLMRLALRGAADAETVGPRPAGQDGTAARRTALRPRDDGGGSKLHDRIGPYELLSVLGEGGFGVVYLAQQDEPLRRQVALKVIKLGMDSREVIARFGTEQHALARMSHPNIAKVLDAGMTERGTPYFVMEHVPGVPITEYCDANRLATRERLELFIPICHAVHHAHQKGIIHRDLKPSNVLVAVEDGQARPKVIDFGIAKAIDQRHAERSLFTQRGVVIGTPAYMSPEQADVSGQEIDTTTDVYSLGVLLYELLSGALPLEPERLREAGYDEVLRIIREEDAPSLPSQVIRRGALAVGVASRRRQDSRGLAKELRGDLDWITRRAIQKDRGRRYASAAELAADITRHLGGEPVAARPRDPFFVAWRWLLLRPAFSVTLLGLLVFVATEQAVLLWLPDPDQAVFHRTSMEIAAAWAAIAALLQAWLSRTRSAGHVHATWMLVNVLLLTVLVRVGDGPRSAMVAMYPLLVASAAFTLAPWIAVMTTAASVAAYLYVCVSARLYRPAEAVSGQDVLVHGVALAVLGVMTTVIVGRLRALSRLAGR